MELVAANSSEDYMDSVLYNLVWQTPRILKLTAQQNYAYGQNV